MEVTNTAINITFKGVISMSDLLQAVCVHYCFRETDFRVRPLGDWTGGFQKRAQHVVDVYSKLSLGLLINTDGDHSLPCRGVA